MTSRQSDGNVLISTFGQYWLKWQICQTCEGGLVPEWAVHVDPGRLPHLDPHCPRLDLDLEGKGRGLAQVTALASAYPALLCSALADKWSSRCVTTSPPTLLSFSHSQLLRSTLSRSCNSVQALVSEIWSLSGLTKKILYVKRILNCHIVGSKIKKATFSFG